MTCRFHVYNTIKNTFWQLKLITRYMITCWQIPFGSTQQNLMFIGPCIIVIVEEWKTNLMSPAILFHLLWAQHVSDINIAIFRSLRLCWWITTSVVLFSVRCVLEFLLLEFLLRLIIGGVCFAGWSTASTCKTNTTNYTDIQPKTSTDEISLLWLFCGCWTRIWY